MRIRSLRWWCLILLVVIGSGLAWILHRSRHNLLAQATRIETTLGGLTEDQVPSGYLWGKYHRSPSYCWLNAREILWIRAGPVNPYEVLRMDLHSGVKTPLPHLERFINESDSSGGTRYAWLPSPDGQWLLFLSASNRRIVYTAIKTAEDKSVVWTNRLVNAMPVWLSNNRGFVEWTSKAQGWAGRLYLLDSPEIQNIEIAPSVAPLSQNNLTEDEGITMLRFDAAVGNKGRLARFSFGPTNISVTQMLVGLPAHLNPADSVPLAAPTGNRLAWLIYFQERWPHFELERQAPFVRSESRFLASLWVSQLDGSGLRELGHLEPGEEIKRVSWTPDGRHLSFVYRDALWSVPAE